MAGWTGVGAPEGIVAQPTNRMAEVKTSAASLTAAPGRKEVSIVFMVYLQRISAARAIISGSSRFATCVLKAEPVCVRKRPWPGFAQKKFCESGLTYFAFERQNGVDKAKF
jgi:hypothetical protein